ncbi:uncharacterized protein LOC126832726 isoform X2 [Adelges cooleyi]|uniref:uncharacterized protein LOC126832726 isoform X2 n=1 Tax=Adelges cooleyi TaxID=133065 RepID=UPI00217FC8E1|nr:uncharacterized protein LOC126832726 isoform X2 [Adelges cooleyi]
MDCIKQRICFSSPTESDIILDGENPNSFQGVLVFFGSDSVGNTLILCMNQDRQLQTSRSMIYYQDYTGQEFSYEEKNQCHDFSSWKMPSLRLQCLVPMQKWRIVFNGRLSIKNEVQHSCHFKINLIWKPLGFPVYCNKLNEFSKEEIDVQCQDAVNTLLGFDQFGVLSGTLVVDGESKTIDLDALKLRRWDMSVGDSVLAGRLNNNSKTFSLQKSKRLNCCRGHLKSATSHEYLKEACDMEITDGQFGESSLIMQHGDDLSIDMRLAGSTAVSLENVSVITGFENGLGGILLYFGNRSQREIDPITADPQVLSVGLTVNLNSATCMHSDVVGNKAKSLAILKQTVVAARRTADNISVPDGICITTAAMRAHLDENKVLLDSIRYAIELTKHCDDVKKLLDCCDGLRDQWLSSEVNRELSDEISLSITENQPYAVRSSGTFEDGDVASSAGQYTTKLGSVALGSIISDVLECWASNFSAHALIYRKNNGQPLMCDMAVIVQRLVDAESAGVLFTRDPMTGDPERIVITSCTGLGDDVASGTVTPDTVVISRQSIARVSDPDVENSSASRTSAAKLRSFENVMVELSKFCVRLEEILNSPVDVEWAVIRDRIYLVQCRPITSIFAWQTSEIVREFDSPFASDDVTMFYNSRDGFPNAVHPLSLTLDFFSLFPLLKLTEGDPTDFYRSKQLLYTSFNCCLNVCQIFQDLEPGSMYSDVIQYAVAGKLFLTDDVWNKILLKNTTSIVKMLKKSILTLQTLYNVKSRLDDVQEKVFNMDVEELIKNANTSSEMLDSISMVLTLLEEVTLCHTASSSNNIVFYTLILVFGFGITKDSTEQCLTKLASLVDNSQVISALILKDLQGVASVLSGKIDKQIFCNLPVQQCHSWLKDNCEEGYRLVEEFIRKYGHRGVQELDLGSETWSTDPDRLYCCLRTLLLIENHQPRIEETQNPQPHKDNVPGGFFRKYCSSYLLTRYQTSILCREQSKDLLVSTTHKLRLCYLKLGRMLVDEGKMTDPKLLFFMSQHELQTVCKHRRCFAVVHRAMKRKQIWPTLSSLQFEDVNIGTPVCKQLDSSSKVSHVVFLHYFSLSRHNGE